MTHPQCRVSGRILSTSALVFCAFLAGCLDTRMTYKEPPAAEDAAVMLVGRDGTYINEVDGSKVRSGEMTSASGGNTVKVTPGKHRLQAYTLANGGRAPGLWRFTFHFERGRTYELSPSSDTTLSLQVKDRATGKVVNVN